MARELVVQRRCDLCPNVATHHKVPVAVGDATRRQTLDLCEVDYKRLIQPLLDALASARPYPVTPTTSRQWKGRALGPYYCKAGCASTPLKNLATFTRHLQVVHDMTRAEYIRRHGELVPMTLEELESIIVEVACEVKGCSKVYSTALGNRWPQQAMRAHMWGRHGIKWKPTLG